MIAQTRGQEMLASDVSYRRRSEALYAIREKDVRSATLERLRVSLESDKLVCGLPQPLQIGEGLYYILDHISVPVHPDDLILGRIAEEIPDEDGELLLDQVARMWGRGIPPWMLDRGHECFDWERLLRLGLPGLENLARDELTRRLSNGETGEQLDFMRGAIRIYQAFRNYARRYALAAYESGLVAQAERCHVLAERPPETFAEALQLIWLVEIVYCTMVSVNSTLTSGRLDEPLIGFYRADLFAGRLTPDLAGDLIEDFYCKNNLILGRGEHQMSEGTSRDTGWLRNLCYDAPQYIVLGGCKQDGSPVANELTEIFLERVVPEFENPVIVLRYTSDLPDHIWQIACDKMRNNASLMVYNDNDVIPAMIHCGIDKRDAVTYTMHGCNWPDIPGKQEEVRIWMPIIPQYVLRALLDDREPKDIDELYNRFALNFRADLERECEQFRSDRENWSALLPGPLRVDHCFLDGPIGRARSWTLGGVKYCTFVCAICSIATAADCFAAVDELVFSSKKVSMKDLKSALIETLMDTNRYDNSA